MQSLFNQMNRQDPPTNQPARQLASRFFGPRGMSAMRVMVDELAGQYVDRLGAATKCGIADVVAELLPLPGTVMCRLLGLPDSETAQLFSWTDALMLANDFNPPGHGLEYSDASAEEFRRNLLSRCHESPLYSALHDGWPNASSDDITDTIMFVAGAGMHTTSSLLGVGVSMLIEHPDIANQLRVQPALMPAFVQECLRYDPPAQFTARWTTGPVQLADVRLPEGTMVLLFLGAAGRDPDRFDEPDRFDPNRYVSGRAPKSLSFGFGQHYCIGSKLAELIAETTFSLLVSECTNLAYAGPVVRSDRLVSHGFKCLPVRESAKHFANHGSDATQIFGETLPEALRQITRRSPRTKLAFPRMSTSLTVGELQQSASRVAVDLHDAGIGRGNLVGLLVPAGPQIFGGLFGVNMLGAAVSMLPVRAVGTQMSSLREIDAILRGSGITHVIADPSFDGLVLELRSRHPGVRFIAFPSGSNGRIPDDEPSPEDLAVVQFTSGSTSDPKGVALPHRTVVAGLRAILTSSETKTSDSLVQWVPHYHDMGLFGPLAYCLAGLDIHVFAPADFIKDPLGFLRYLAVSGVSAMAGPDFGYRLLTGALAANPQDDLDLARWRLAYNGAEPVLGSTVSGFTHTTTRYGAPETVMFPVYGLAEATLAVAFPEPGTVPTVLHLDAADLANSRYARVVTPGASGSKIVVSVGKPVDGMQVRIVDSAGTVTEPGRVGEIEICGPSVTPGYYRATAYENSTERFNGRWLRTGDLGFELNRNLYITGRAKDMIVVHGRNYFPEDAEAVACEIDGVFRKRCAAFTSDDHLMVVVECADPGRYEALAEAVRRTVSEVMGIAAVRVAVIEQGGLPYTTSGKVRRSAVKSQLALEGV
ncbi:cytochrome P450 [Mycobacteroides chelonae]